MIIRRIRVLEPQLANKIAAGEVVERPASVVKELVENSLDAGATSVTVEIREGGAEYIRVTDNGCGITAEDVQKAFLRHATSKLISAEGLDGIETLGFRGEALASIASVSHVTMRTRTEEDEFGTLIKLDGGEVAECMPCGCPQGTNIEVRELFYNVPARLKFLKAARAEAAAVGDYMLRLILGNTRVSFKFINNGKPVFHSAGDGSLENALLCVYGSDIAEHIKPVYYDDGYLLIEGFCGDEYISKSSRAYQSVFVNGRYIRSQQISYAAQRAYNTRLMTGRFPFLALNITVSPREVDVNVHPNKLTVRFRDEERVFSAVMVAVREALEGTAQAPAKQPAPGAVKYDDVYSVFHADRERNADSAPVLPKETEPASEPAVQTTAEPPASIPAEPAASIPAEPAPEQNNEIPSHSTVPAPSEGANVPVYYVRDSASGGMAAEKADVNGVLYYDLKKPQEPPAEKAEQIRLEAGAFRIIGVAFDTYIIVEQGEAVFLIDQHAAHERLNYEKLIRGELRFDSQLLLTSQVIGLTPTEFNCICENMERFRELGFEIDEFGALSVSVHAVPTGTKAESVERLVHDMIGIIMQQGSISELDVVRGALIRSSCKQAIKAGQPLDNAAIDSLLSHYAGGSVPLTCPHGRPVMVRITKRELEKMFKRIV